MATRKSGICPHGASSLTFDLFSKHGKNLNIDLCENIKSLYEAKEEDKICILRRSLFDYRFSTLWYPGSKQKKTSHNGCSLLLGGVNF